MPCKLKIPKNNRCHIWVRPNADEHEQHFMRENQTQQRRKNNKSKSKSNSESADAGPQNMTKYELHIAQ